ncbi:MAG: transposase [Candidatus Ozemobacteraceae bacterium]
MRIKEPSVRYILLCLMCRFLSCRSIWEIALHYGVPKDPLYQSVNKLKSLTQLMAIRQPGLQELAQHLRKLSKASAATISRQRVLLFVDDATEKTRGVLGSSASLIWSGADKKVVSGVNTQALVAVIGDTSVVTVLDARICLPKHTGEGAQPMLKNEWFTQSLERLETKLNQWGLSLNGCHVSVDRAYASEGVLKLLKTLHLPLISQVAGGWNLEGEVLPGLTLVGKATPILKTWFQLNQANSSPWVENRGSNMRTVMKAKSLGPILVVARKIGEEVKFLLSTDLTMKAVTVHRDSRRRWKLERVFWDWKQRVGMGDVHQHTPEVCMTRWYQQIILVQALRVAAKESHVPLPKFIWVLRWQPNVIVDEILSGSVFSLATPSETVTVEREAA